MAQSEKMRVPKELADDVRRFQRELETYFDRRFTIPKTWGLYIKKLKNGDKTGKLGTTTFK